MKVFLKDPDAKLDFGFDWSEWLTSPEIIDSYGLDVPSDLTMSNDSMADGIVTFWLEGGIVGKVYVVSCEITTTAGRIDERSMLLKMKNR